MVKNLLTVAFMAAIVYAAYVVNVEFFSDKTTSKEAETPPSGAGSAPAQPALVTPAPAPQPPQPANTRLYICQKKTMAYSKAPPYDAFGFFHPGSALEVGEPFADSGMLNVTFQSSKGETILALCKPQDVGETPPSKPLEKPTLSIGKKLGDGKSLLDSQKGSALGSSQPGSTQPSGNPYSGFKQKAKDANK